MKQTANAKLPSGNMYVKMSQQEIHSQSPNTLID